MKPNKVKFLYLIINNANKSIKESNRNKYLTLVSTDESKDKLEKYEKNGAKLKILLDQQIITEVDMMKNIRKST